MSWLEDIQNSIRFVENHMEEELTVEQIAAEVNLSPFYFQKGFSILCGVTISDYIRNRRLSLAGRDLQINGDKVIDVAMRYGYESPDSFAKAFSRFHGITPSQARCGEGELKNFLPLKIHMTMKGGFEMECKIVKKPAFKVIGCSKIIDMEEGYLECPKFWNEYCNTDKLKYVGGTFGICLDDEAEGGKFKYMIADEYDENKEYPDGFEITEIPANTWAVFPCRGAMPKALQDVNTGIFTEWLPGNSDYEIAGMYNIEFYTSVMDYPKGNQDENYYCEIWMPVKTKAAK